MEHGTRLCSKGISRHEDKLQNAILSVLNDMIEHPETVENALMDTLARCRQEITAIDARTAEINADIERIYKWRDLILETITGEAFEQFRQELKDLNAQELHHKNELEQLDIRKEKVQLTIKKSVTARELFANMLPVTEFDDNMIPKLIERVDAVDKKHIRIVFRGGLEIEGDVEK